MKAIRYEKDSVLIEKGKIMTWVDVWVENEDIRYDWNKYIFFLYKKPDVYLKNWQKNTENFEDATKLAVVTLEDRGIIHNKNGKWHKTEKYFSLRGSIAIK